MSKEAAERVVLALLRTARPFDVIQVAVNQTGSEWSINVTRKEVTILRVLDI